MTDSRESDYGCGPKRGMMKSRLIEPAAVNEIHDLFSNTDHESYRCKWISLHHHVRQDRSRLLRKL